jgi:ankyrin repeat protein
MKRRRAILWIIALLLIFLGLPVWLVQRQIRQERLDAALIAALDNDQHARALQLLRQGADPNARERERYTSPFWERLLIALHLRTPSEQVEATEPALILAYDLEELPDKATRSMRIEVMSALLERGADPNSRDIGNYTILMWASTRGENEMIKLMLEHGADVHQINEGGVTALMMAARWHADTSRLLLTHGAKIDQSDEGGDTPLHWAVLGDPLNDPKEIRRMVELLLQHGARNVPNKNGETPIDYARQNQLPEIVQLIQAAERKRKQP